MSNAWKRFFTLLKLYDYAAGDLNWHYVSLVNETMIIQQIAVSEEYYRRIVVSCTL